MRHFWTVVVVVASGPAAAWAQDELNSPEISLPRELASVEILQERVGHYRLSLALLGRASIPGNGQVSTAGLAYSDLFNVGGGVGLEADLMMPVGGGVEFGGYLSGTYDSYGGQSATDEFGNVIDPDPLRVSTVIIGAKVLGHYGWGWFWEGFAGVGLAHFAATNATVTDFGFPPATVQLFREANHGVFEIGARAGWSSPHVGVMFGVSYRIGGGPGRGKDVSEVIDPDLFDSIVLDVGIKFTF